MDEIIQKLKAVKTMPELDALRLETVKAMQADGQTVSFRERLNEMIANGDKFPCFFASTEY